MKRSAALVLTLVIVGLVVVGSGSAVATSTDFTASITDDPIQYADNTTNESDDNTTTVNDSEENTTTVNDLTTANETTETETASDESDLQNETVDANETDDAPEANETVTENDSEAVADEISPGARLSGVIGVHGAELEGAVSERAFGLSVAAAVSNGSKARIVGNQTTHLETRLQELQNESEELQAAYENGTITNGTYYARAARLTAQINSLQRMINRTVEESEQLPMSARMSHGVNETRLTALHAAAGNATGQDVAAIARSIAGPNPGHPAGVRGPPGNTGPRMGPPTNDTRGPPENRTQGPPDNRTHGPPDNRTMGPSNHTMMGPTNNSTMGPPENVTTGQPENSTQETDTDSTTGPSNEQTQGPPDDRKNGSTGNETRGHGGSDSKKGGPPQSVDTRT